jgi:2-(3-amino-3-carboxypropyl)histidine synthase
VLPPTVVNSSPLIDGVVIYTTPLFEHDRVAIFPGRSAEIEKARGCSQFGLILGTLGRQGNPMIMERLEAALASKSKQYTIVLLSEITPAKVA